MATAKTVPVSTIGTYLMHGTGSGSTTYAKLVDIKDFSDLGGVPESLETTTLSNDSQTFCEGVKQMTAITFTANYVSADYDTLYALKGKNEKYAVYFGDNTGSDGKFTFEGTLSVVAKGGGTNSVREMTITIMPSTEITKASAT